APSTSIIQNQPQPSKSPQFWDSGIMVVFSAVQANSLRCHSKVLDDIFGIPPSTQSQNQGTEVNPIALPASITAEKFESFLMYLNCRGWNKFDDKVAANILNLLDISALLEADGALSYAMSKVVGLNLPAPQLLGLAWRHRAHPQVWDWIEPAVMGLLSTPLRCHNEEQECSIGLAYPIIAKARERIQEARLVLAAIPFQLAPRDILFPKCPDELHQYCEKSWLFFWYQNITVELIHPTKPPLSYSGLVQLVEKTKFENLQEGCKSRTVERMKSYQDYPTVPNVFHTAVSEVVQLFNIPHDESGDIEVEVTVEVDAKLVDVDKVEVEVETRARQFRGRDGGGGIDVEAEVEVEAETETQARQMPRQRWRGGGVEVEAEVETRAGEAMLRQRWRWRRRQRHRQRGGGVEVEAEVETHTGEAMLRRRHRRGKCRGGDGGGGVDVEAEAETRAQEEDVKDLLHEDASDVLSCRQAPAVPLKSTGDSACVISHILKDSA
ncbi:hypothetical protein EV359DRAFT_68876, partial [Lentinula novae-zelandiae]